MVTEPLVRARIRQYYELHPNAEETRASFQKKLPDINPHTINHHLKLLLDEGFLERKSHGKYTLNPRYAGGSVVGHRMPSGRGRLHLPPSLPEGLDEDRRVNGEQPQFADEYTGSTVAYFVHTYTNSLLERMERSGFPEADIQFISALISERYPPRRRLVDH